MADLLVFSICEETSFPGNGSCGNQSDSHTLTMEKVKVHQLFDCMSYGVAKIKKSTLSLFLGIPLYNPGFDGTAFSDHNGKYFWIHSADNLVICAYKVEKVFIAN